VKKFVIDRHYKNKHADEYSKYVDQEKPIINTIFKKFVRIIKSLYHTE